MIKWLIKFWVINEFFDWPCSWFTNRDNGSKVMLSIKEGALQIVKVKIYTEYEQGKIWMLREHHGVRQVIAVWARWC